MGRREKGDQYLCDGLFVVTAQTGLSGALQEILQASPQVLLGEDALSEPSQLSTLQAPEVAEQPGSDKFSGRRRLMVSCLQNPGARGPAGRERLGMLGVQPTGPRASEW